MTNGKRSSAAPASSRRTYRPAVGPRLGRLLAVVFALFALMAVNAVYLISVTIAGVRFQNWFYLVMFTAHLVLGLLLVLPVVIFGVLHIRNARNRPNRRAIRAGYALFATALVVLATGFVLMRVDVAGIRLEVLEHRPGQPHGIPEAAPCPERDGVFQSAPEVRPSDAGTQ